MKALIPIIGIFRKELAQSSRFRLALFARLLIGPIVSALTAGLLYAGFFRANSNQALGEINPDNMQTFLLTGILVHMYLNSGYYYLSQKFMQEWISRTLPLLWASPSSQLALVLGHSTFEYLRCFILSVFATLFLISQGTRPLWAIALHFAAILPIFLLGVGLGYLRSSWNLVNEGKADLADHGYMGALLLGCLYIPKSFLPQWLWPLVELNPIYHARQILIKLWSTPQDLAYHGVLLLCGLITIVLGCSLVWKTYRSIILERSHA